jgi:soluble lytic murein transglycosylase-like protein
MLNFRSFGAACRFVVVAGAGLVGLAPMAGATPAGRTAEMEAMVARHARAHGVPERLVHRIIMRESRYNPRVVARGNYGLMQIKPGTARGMGFSGAPSALLDPDVNMTYAVPYLANAYRAARGNEDLAVRYYAGGWYYAAKRMGMLESLRTARSEPLEGVSVKAASAPPSDMPVEETREAAPRTRGAARAALVPLPPPAPAELRAAQIENPAPEATSEPAGVTRD